MQYLIWKINRETEKTEEQLAVLLVLEEMSGPKKPIKGPFSLPDLMRGFNICINYGMYQDLNLISSILPLLTLLLVIRQEWWISTCSSNNEWGFFPAWWCLISFHLTIFLAPLLNHKFSGKLEKGSFCLYVFAVFCKSSRS